MSTKVAGIAVAVMALAVGRLDAAGIYITEWMYSGSEFIEFTNLSSSPINMSGWSYDDSTGIVNSVDLSSFGVVASGESVILSEGPAEDFRTEWGLSASIKIIGPNAENLGRSDTINLYDNLDVLADSLQFGDQDFPGTIRTQNFSGNPNSNSALGTNSVADWSLAFVGDAFGSYASVGNFIGNPGSYPAVPEPTSFAMAGAGLIAMWAVRRRRSGK